MKLNKIKSFIILGLFCLTTSANALFYGDVNLGYANTGSNSIDGWDNQKKGLLGYQVNVGIFFLPFLAAEVGYNGFTDLEYTNNNQTENPSLNGYHVALKGQVDLPIDLYVMGKVGLGSLTQSSFSNVGSQTNYNFYWSVGAGYDLTKMFYLEAAYMQIQGSQQVPTAGLLSLGIGINLL
ncbi:porin family protein [Francisellaceae bacterium]|nr:porin family protein [Francisellaceae bacterium]